MGYNILPADRYKVISKTILSDIDKKNLMGFYMPIVGPIAISIYLTLWEDLGNDDESPFLLHHHLMSILKCSSKSIKEARDALEAVGLIRTYVKEENVLIYIYELYSPLSATELFNHPIFSVVLYNNMGSEEYEKLAQSYQKKKYDLSEYTEITKQLDDVYEPRNIKEVFDIKERQNADVILTSQIDYDLIVSSVPKKILNEKALNKKTKELIDNLSFIYNADTLKMIEFIRKSLNEYGMIDKTLLKETARKNYELSSGSLPTIVYRSQPEYLKKAGGDTSIRSKAIALFENTSPYDYLKMKNKGVNPTVKELELVEYLLLDLELTPAVVNVLLDYSLRKNNNRLTKGYVETIAAQWRKAGIKTATEAMDFAAKENKRMTKGSSAKTKKEVDVPSWFNKDIAKEEVSEEEKSELENILKEFN
ncbi:MAG: hypothetical protein GX951_05195 [Mollicutes bacterium]|nr:hypothetical protein [Mollicutes bacterium]